MNACAPAPPPFARRALLSTAAAAVAVAALTGCDRAADPAASSASRPVAGLFTREDSLPAVESSDSALFELFPDDTVGTRADAPVSSPFLPPPYSGIYPEEEAALLTGEFIFEPDPIPDEGIPVGNAELMPGEVLQVHSGGFWWAGVVLEIESENEVLIGYFGWDESFDERKDRMDLKFNPRAAQAAVYTKYWPIVF